MTDTTAIQIVARHTLSTGADIAHNRRVFSLAPSEITLHTLASSQHIPIIAHTTIPMDIHDFLTTLRIVHTDNTHQIVPISQHRIGVIQTLRRCVFISASQCPSDVVLALPTDIVVGVQEIGVIALGTSDEIVLLVAR